MRIVDRVSEYCRVGEFDPSKLGMELPSSEKKVRSEEMAETKGCALVSPLLTMETNPCSGGELMILLAMMSFIVSCELLVCHSSALPNKST